MTRVRRRSGAPVETAGHSPSRARRCERVRAVEWPVYVDVARRISLACNWPPGLLVAHPRMSMATTITSPLTIVGPSTHFSDRVLTPEALDFVARLQQEFGPRRESLLARRKERLAGLMSG